MASEHGVPVVFEPLGIDEESQQSFSQAKLRHHDPRTLARYAKLGIEAGAALTA